VAQGLEDIGKRARGVFDIVHDEHPTRGALRLLRASAGQGVRLGETPSSAIGAGLASRKNPYATRPPICEFACA
jgi:hypothetical protein